MFSYYTDVRCFAFINCSHWVRTVNKSLLPSSRSTTVLFLGKVLNPLLLQWSYSDDRSHWGCTKLPPGVNVYSCVCNCDQKNKTKQKTLSETSLLTTLNMKCSKKEENKSYQHTDRTWENGVCVTVTDLHTTLKSEVHLENVNKRSDHLYLNFD